MENPLTDLHKYYLGLDNYSLKFYLNKVNTATKERIDSVDDLPIIIDYNDQTQLFLTLKPKP